jgi:tetratricopeptide (TPR) repeat protein
LKGAVSMLVNARAVARVAVTGAIALHAGQAFAQPQPVHGDKPQPLNLEHAELGGAAEFANVGRARMRRGDYAGALDAFDEALRTSIDVTLYRDRGLCHEKLGQPYPAIQDYRTYLTKSPQAVDADAIGVRLRTLEDQVADSDDVPPPGLNAGASEEETKVTAPASRATPQPDVDDDVQLSSLRAGKGWGFAAFFAGRKWIRDTGVAAFSTSETWAECLGAQLRYSTGSHGALLLEAGYEHFNSTSTDPEVVSGFTSLLAFELRVPLGGSYDNQFLVAPGIGYEELVFSPSDVGLSPYSEGALAGRVRAGYRHMLGASVAADLSLEGGWAAFFKYDGSTVDEHDSTGAMVAGNVAIAWGL